MVNQIDIKTDSLRQGLGVTITARKCSSKLAFTMKDLGHTLPGQIFLSVKIKHLQATVDVLKPYKTFCLFV